ncbi:hypothetical protein VNO78_06505 [Psophocarpus tetragonolobus]|uniref:Uncharacterized protein n=1 Tax=Psophocarpus tetragonolobus TaxID=3891 RepID=A0AAN9SSD9_PSOTE
MVFWDIFWLWFTCVEPGIRLRYENSCIDHGEQLKTQQGTQTKEEPEAPLSPAMDVVVRIFKHLQFWMNFCFHSQTEDVVIRISMVKHEACPGNGKVIAKSDGVNTAGDNDVRIHMHILWRLNESFVSTAGVSIPMFAAVALLSLMALTFSERHRCCLIQSMKLL